MIETLYLDSNILLNVLLEDAGLAGASLSLLQKVESGKYSATMSIFAVMEIHRILQKQGKTEEEITDAVRKIPSLGIEIMIPEGSEMISAYEYVKTLRVDPADSIHLSCALASWQRLCNKG
ncbi:MAG: PIN domain-containing protein [Candidatus Altiarchaeia archaeon]